MGEDFCEKNAKLVNRGFEDCHYSGKKWNKCACEGFRVFL